MFKFISIVFKAVRVCLFLSRSLPLSFSICFLPPSFFLSFPLSLSLCVCVSLSSLSFLSWLSSHSNIYCSGNILCSYPKMYFLSFFYLIRSDKIQFNFQGIVYMSPTLWNLPISPWVKLILPSLYSHITVLTLLVSLAFYSHLIVCMYTC